MLSNGQSGHLNMDVRRDRSQMDAVYSTLQVTMERVVEESSIAALLISVMASLDG